MPGRILSHIEALLVKRIGEHFDMIAGTSTGGILACALLFPDGSDPAKPGYSADEVVDLYFEYGRDIFSIPFWHKVRTLRGLMDEKFPVAGLESTLNRYFGETMLSELIRPTLITAYDIDNRKAEFFTQHDAVRNPAKDFKVKDIARATSAAPTYFECAKVPSDPESASFMTLVDGGVFANNPGLCAYAEARNLFPKPGKGIPDRSPGAEDNAGSGDKNRVMATAIDLEILSLGTGYSEKSYPYRKASRWGKAQWIRPVIDIMMSGVSETVDYQLEQIFKSVNAPGQYLRINGQMPPEVSPDMDNVREENLVALKKFGDALFSTYEKDISEFLKL